MDLVDIGFQKSRYVAVRITPLLFSIVSRFGLWWIGPSGKPSEGLLSVRNISVVFNLYNKANLTGCSGDLTSAAFGQPTNRSTQVFGLGWLGHNEVLSK
jgi:hypothetical protein